MKNVTMSIKKKTNFEKLKTATEGFITTVEEIIKDPELHEKEFLESTLESVKSLREACEAKLADS